MKKFLPILCLVLLLLPDPALAHRPEARPHHVSRPPAHHAPAGHYQHAPRGGIHLMLGLPAWRVFVGPMAPAWPCEFVYVPRMGYLPHWLWVPRHWTHMGYSVPGHWEWMG